MLTVSLTVKCSLCLTSRLRQSVTLPSYQLSLLGDSARLQRLLVTTRGQLGINVPHFYLVSQNLLSLLFYELLTVKLFLWRAQFKLELDLLMDGCSCGNHNARGVGQACVIMEGKQGEVVYKAIPRGSSGRPLQYLLVYLVLLVQVVQVLGLELRDSAYTLNFGQAEQHYILLTMSE